MHIRNLHGKDNSKCLSKCLTECFMTSLYFRFLNQGYILESMHTFVKYILRIDSDNNIYTLRCLQIFVVFIFILLSCVCYRYVLSFYMYVETFQEGLIVFTRYYVSEAFYYLEQKFSSMLH